MGNSGRIGHPAITGIVYLDLFSFCTNIIIVIIIIIIVTVIVINIIIIINDITHMSQRHNVALSVNVNLPVTVGQRLRYNVDDNTDDDDDGHDDDGDGHDDDGDDDDDKVLMPMMIVTMMLKYAVAGDLYEKKACLTFILILSLNLD